MKCPYCDKEMEKGVIQSPNEITWQKKGHLFNRADMHDGAVCLSQYSFLKGSSVDVCLCRNCHKMIIDFNDTQQ